MNEDCTKGVTGIVAMSYLLDTIAVIATDGSSVSVCVSHIDIVGISNANSFIHKNQSCFNRHV